MKATYFDAKPLAAVIALPGLVGSDEPSRIDHILKNLSGQGILGVRLDYVSVTDFGNSRICSVDPHKTTRDIARFVREELIGDMGFNPNQIGLIANSVGAIPATYFLQEKAYRSIWPGAYCAISPLVKTPMGFSELPPGNVEVTNKNDIVRGRRRFLDRNDYDSLIDLDLSEELRGLPFLRTRVVFGKKDHLTGPSKMAAYHLGLGGKESDLIALNSGHDLPRSNHFVTGFFMNHFLK